MILVIKDEKEIIWNTYRRNAMPITQLDCLNIIVISFLGNHVERIIMLLNLKFIFAERYEMAAFQCLMITWRIMSSFIQGEWDNFSSSMGFYLQYIDWAFIIYRFVDSFYKRILNITYFKNVSTLSIIYLTLVLMGGWDWAFLVGRGRGGVKSIHTILISENFSNIST